MREISTMHSWRLALATMAVLVTGGAGNSQEMPPLPQPQAYTAGYLSDRAQIVDVINSIGSFADQRRWNLVASAFADEVVLDYSSSETAAAGQVSQTLTPEQIVAAWQTQLPGYLHTHHAITNHLVHVEGDRARAFSLIHATHYLPNEEGEAFWIFVGNYEHELARTPAGWRISRMRATKLFDLGNKDLPNLASARVKAGQSAAGP